MRLQVQKYILTESKGYSEEKPLEYIYSSLQFEELLPTSNQVT